MNKNNVIYGLLALGLLVLSFVLLPKLFSEKEYAQLSHFDLLNARDVQQAAKQAIILGESEELQQQLIKIIDIAEAMPLRPESIRFLRSSQAEDYLTFQAKRAIFDDKLIQHFNNLTPIDELKQAYPEAQDKFAEADEMILARDKKFAQIVQTLMDNGLDETSAKTTATTMWKEKFL